MRVYKHITFSEGLSMTLAEFKKDFAPHLVTLSEVEIKEAHKAATQGNGKLSASTATSKKTNTPKDND